MTLQLELGKKYINRCGEAVEIVDASVADLYSYLGNNRQYYTNNGTWYEDEESPEDLVSEYVEPSTKPAETSTKTPHKHSTSIPNSLGTLVPHKHADLIIAWAQGETIEYLDEEDGEFYYTDKPSWDVRTVYRVKPEKKIQVCVDKNSTLIYRSSDGIVFVVEKSGIQITIEDGKLVKVEVL